MKIIKYLAVVLLIISCTILNEKYEKNGVLITFMDFNDIKRENNQNKLNQNKIALFFPIARSKNIYNKGTYSCKTNKKNNCLSCECSLMDFDKFRDKCSQREGECNKYNINKINVLSEIYRNIVQDNDSVSFAVLIQYARRMNSKYLGIVEYGCANKVRHVRLFYIAMCDNLIINKMHIYDTTTGGYLTSVNMNSE